LQQTRDRPPGAGFRVFVTAQNVRIRDGRFLRLAPSKTSAAGPLYAGTRLVAPE